MIKKLSAANKSNKKILVLNEQKSIQSITYNFPDENIINFTDQTSTKGVCIDCELKPCLSLPMEIIDFDIIDSMPFNNDSRICPTNAIKQNNEGLISINSNLCINCGVCFSKCPTAGIFYNSKIESFDINHSYDDSFDILDFNNDLMIERTFNEFKNSKHNVVIDKISREFAYNFTSKFKSLNSSIPDLELILVRNLLLAVGINNKVSAKGNNDLRLDFIGLHSGKFLPGESELVGSDILGLPRRILEGITWLHSRKKILVENQIPCVVLFEFPRNRSDFYEVISDIENVTGVKIKTLSIYFLSILSLHQKKLTSEDLNNHFSINKENQDYGVYFKLFIENIETIDANYGSVLYTFTK